MRNNDGYGGKFKLRHQWVAALKNSTESTQRDILEQILLHYPKRIARWIATHCPERLLPNKEAAGVLDALEGWGKEPPQGWVHTGIPTYFANGWTYYRGPISSLPTTPPPQQPVNFKSITKAHGNNNNNPSK